MGRVVALFGDGPLSPEAERQRVEGLAPRVAEISQDPRHASQSSLHLYEACLEKARRDLGGGS